jgi:hypothetical protein
MIVGWGMVAQTVMTQYQGLMSHAILIGTSSPIKNNGVSEKIFWKRALKTVNDLDDGYVLFFEPPSESNKNMAKLSSGRIARGTEDLDISVSKECYGNQQKAVDNFCEDNYYTLRKLTSSKIPILVFDIFFICLPCCIFYIVINMPELLCLFVKLLCYVMDCESVITTHHGHYNFLE